jgi:glycerol-3-phosphate acyltransferase PlsX
MGGDTAPEVVFQGISLCAKELGPISLQLYGVQAAIEPLVEEIKKDTACKDLFIEVILADDVVTSDMKPKVAVRSHRASSMGLAVMAVREKRADAVLSAGNTGAFMAFSKIMLGTLKGIDRPAIATFLPTSKGQSLVLDLGANAECSGRNLVEFSFMGEALTQACLGISAPSIGLLNIGSENTKGNRIVQEAAEILTKTDLLKNYIGFVEGTDIMAGTVDVVVTDGFTGNVALKTIEGSMRFVKEQVGRAVKKSIGTRISAFILYRTLKKAFTRFDPRIYNGAVLLGLNALAVKSHGNVDAFSFAHALKFTVNVARQDLLTHVKTYVDRWASTEEGTSRE